MSVRAAVLTGDRTVETHEFPDVAVLGRSEALLRVEGCGMCGSDVEAYHGATAKKGLLDYPVIPGHESVGRIAAIDDEARDLWGLDVGARVAVVAGPRCGTCDFCLVERPGWRPCPHGVTYGYRSTTVGSGLWGGFAEYLHLLPGSVLMRMPDDLTVQDCVLFNPLAAGFDWVVRSAGTQVGDTVLILGAGQRGLASVIAAAETGAAQIIVTGLERDRKKLDLARRLGATLTVNVEEDSVVEAVRDVTNGRGAERVIEATPLASQPVLDALDAARWGATIVLAGLKGQRPIPSFPVDTIAHKVLTLVGVLGTSVWANEQAIRTVASRAYPLDELHSHSLGIDDVEHAMQLLAGEVDDDDAIHITIVP
jgi:threonine dehydrogenase-like Zn-dependent dehydrogenase